MPTAQCGQMIGPDRVTEYDTYSGAFAATVIPATLIGIAEDSVPGASYDDGGYFEVYATSAVIPVGADGWPGDWTMTQTLTLLEPTMGSVLRLTEAGCGNYAGWFDNYVEMFLSCTDVSADESFVGLRAYGPGGIVLDREAGWVVPDVPITVTLAFVNATKAVTMTATQAGDTRTYSVVLPDPYSTYEYSPGCTLDGIGVSWLGFIDDDADPDPFAGDMVSIAVWEFVCVSVTPGAVRGLRIEVCGEGPCVPFEITEQDDALITLAEQMRTGWGT